MIPAYDESYVGDAQECLADLLVYLVDELGMSADQAWALFLKSRFPALMEKGDFRVIAGMSGFEVAQRLLYEELGQEPPYPVPAGLKEPGSVHWAGSALAYFQWETGIGFAAVTEKVPFRKIVRMYTPLHEADVSVFVRNLAKQLRSHGDENLL